MRDPFSYFIFSYRKHFIVPTLLSLIFAKLDFPDLKIFAKFFSPANKKIPLKISASFLLRFYSVMVK